VTSTAARIVVGIVVVVTEVLVDESVIRVGWTGRVISRTPGAREVGGQRGHLHVNN
jgi:hypothetical protein